jgi:hypothetical protein
MAEVIKDQLISCVASYKQIIDYFATTNKSQKYNYDNRDEESVSVTSFLEARLNIISALVSLNFLLSDVVSVTSDPTISIIGRVCLAPRLLDGTHDVCVVTDVVLDEGDSGGAVSEVLIHWVYPRNVYELWSSGIKVVVGSGLRVYTQAMHTERVSALQALAVGDAVLVSK